MFGLDPDTERNIKQAFAEIPVIDKVILYGSRAKGNYRNGSDIDITLFGDKLTLSNSVYPLTDGLEDLNLPYMFDISIFSHIDNENLIEHIHRAGKVLYLKEKGLPKGDALSLPKGDALSLPKGDALSLPKGDALSLPKGDALNLPKGDALSLPKGWEVKKLGEVITLEYGKPLDKYKRIDKGQYPVYGANGIKAKTNEYYYDKKTIIVGRKGSAGEINLTEERFWPLDVSYFVKFEKKQIDLYFLYFWLSKLNLPKLAKGVKPGINRNDVYDLAIPLPPLPEQKRIVAILEKAFTAIDQAKANTEKNLKNARELFQSKLQETFDNGKLKIDSGEWEEKKLGEVCLIERGSSPRPIKKYFTSGEDGVNWIKIGDTKGVNKYIYSTRQKITKEGAKKSRHVQAGDFILSNSMSYGKPYIMKTDGYIHDGWFVLRLHHFVDTEYFFQLLSSPYVNNQFHNLASGSVVKNINGDLVKKVILPIPPFAEQKQIVKKLDSVSIETKKLETIYQRKITCLDELKKSILQKAFRGEL